MTLSCFGEPDPDTPKNIRVKVEFEVEVKTDAIGQGEESAHPADDKGGMLKSTTTTSVKTIPKHLQPAHIDRSHGEVVMKKLACATTPEVVGEALPELHEVMRLAAKRARRNKTRLHPVAPLNS
ncbi:hypothetical protein RJ55_00486 [Drechmeria coniospora]|nr:hypothetical protein RJ55_00486 [Drechmeria coniospora]